MAAGEHLTTQAHVLKSRSPQSILEFFWHVRFRNVGIMDMGRSYVMTMSCVLVEASVLEFGVTPPGCRVVDSLSSLEGCCREATLTSMNFDTCYRCD
jgi:hypothetical protein